MCFQKYLTAKTNMDAEAALEMLERLLLEPREEEERDTAESECASSGSEEEIREVGEPRDPASLDSLLLLDKEIVSMFRPGLLYYY